MLRDMARGERELADAQLAKLSLLLAPVGALVALGCNRPAWRDRDGTDLAALTVEAPATATSPRRHRLDPGRRGQPVLCGRQASS